MPTIKIIAETEIIVVNNELCGKTCPFNEDVPADYCSLFGRKLTTKFGPKFQYYNNRCEKCLNAWVIKTS